MDELTDAERRLIDLVRAADPIGLPLAEVDAKLAIELEHLGHLEPLTYLGQRRTRAK